MAAEQEAYSKEYAELVKEYEEARKPQQEEVNHLDDKLNSDDEETDSSYVYDAAPISTMNVIIARVRLINNIVVSSVLISRLKSSAL